jgi:hypothetical protein
MSTLRVQYSSLFLLFVGDLYYITNGLVREAQYDMHRLNLTTSTSIIYIWLGSLHTKLLIHPCMARVCGFNRGGCGLVDLFAGASESG